MPIRFSKNVAYLSGNCDSDDAEPLLEWFQEHPKGKVNLKECEDMHTAVLQILMAAKAKVTVYPLNKKLFEQPPVQWRPSEAAS